ncbi:MAG: InterPro IPR005806 COGs COG2146, partial [uncultured Ramlibacter sp.]
EGGTERAAHANRPRHGLRGADAALLAAGRAGRRIRSPARCPHGPAAGEGASHPGAGPGAVPGPERRLGAAGSRLSAPRCGSVLRAARGGRPAVPFPRLEVRCRGCLPGNTRRAGRQQALRTGAPAQLSGAGEKRRAVRVVWRAGPAAPALPFVRLLCRARHAHLRLQGPVALQLAAGVRGRHRPGPPVVPAPVPQRCGARRHRRQRRGQAVPQRQCGRGRRRRALAHDADHAGVPPAGDQLRGQALGPATDGAAADDAGVDARARHQRDLPAHLRHPAVGDADHHPDARAGGRHPHLLVFDLHQLRGAGRQGG